jgi:hypothetical protein
MARMKKGHIAPEYSNAINFHDSNEVGLILSRIHADMMDYEEMKIIVTNLIYRISFYLKNKIITDAGNIKEAL